jgi:hypothetical protein
MPEAHTRSFAQYRSSHVDQLPLVQACRPGLPGRTSNDDSMLAWMVASPRRSAIADLAMVEEEVHIAEEIKVRGCQIR